MSVSSTPGQHGPRGPSDSETELRKRGGFVALKNPRFYENMVFLLDKKSDKMGVFLNLEHAYELLVVHGDGPQPLTS